MELSNTDHIEITVLLGVAVFQNLHNSENVRSIHVYKRHKHAHFLQQEFLSKGGALTEICVPFHIACSWEAVTHVDDYMNLVRARQETEGWICLLDFCTTPPSPHSASTGSALLVANAWSYATALFVNANNEHQDCPINWERPQHIASSISACFKILVSWPPIVYEETATESTDENNQRLQLDLLQQWGSDLELASPRFSKSFETPLPTASSSATIPFAGNNVESYQWTQTNVERQPLKSWDTMKSSQSEGMGFNVIEVACSFFSPDVNPNSNTGKGFKHSRISANVLPVSSSTTTNTGSNHGSIVANVPPLDLNQVGLISLDSSIELHDSRRNGYCDSSPHDCKMSMPISSNSSIYSCIDGRSEEAECETINDDEEFISQPDQRTQNAGKATKNHKSNNSKAGNGRLSELTKDELTHYFNMPIAQASKELKVGLTVLKKRCRIIGIPRWPHRKMKSINGLIRNIQELIKTSGEDGDANQIQVAVEDLEKQKKEMQKSPGYQLPERTKRLRQACFKASYRKRRQELQEFGIHYYGSGMYNNNCEQHSSHCLPSKEV
ncbi:hypothetical protein KP509_24G073100 [Ceratopteris richardii]|uniref:RWP-RK domain-containing protein n=2 Tax=Ceratopteris richardii TaxID=49495 RepID=A0A8T2RWA1_CERRI|nr:hypothetical protein KP509_24G073100 [Ceratopteris richardii]